MAAESEAHRAAAVFEVREPVLVRMASRPRGAAPATVDAAEPVSGARQLAADPLLGQAVRVASGSLAHSLARLTTDEGASALGRKRTLSAARTLTRYARRAGARPTPFGLFAGVGTARFGSVAKAGPGTGEVAVRLDGAWLRRRVLAWLEEPSVRRRVDVVLNDLCFVRDGRLYLRTGAQEQSVRDNALVGAVRERARNPVPYADLLVSLAERFPALDAERLDGQLAGLLQHGFLLTSITPHRIDVALLDGIEAVLDGRFPTTRGRCGTYGRPAPGISRILRGWAATPGRTPWTRSAGSMSPERATTRTPGRLCTWICTCPGSSSSPRRSAGRCAGTRPRSGRSPRSGRRWRTCGTTASVSSSATAPPVPCRWASWSTRTADSACPPSTARSRYARGGPGDEADGPRRAMIGELLQEAVLSGGDLVLTDEVVGRLGEVAGHDPAAAPPRSLELCFQVLSESTAALDRGEFRLLGSPHIGAWTAGATAGRFAAAAGLTDELARLAAESTDDTVITAQVELMPHEPRGLNIVQVPRLLPYRIPVGVPDDRRDPAVWTGARCSSPPAPTDCGCWIRGAAVRSVPCCRTCWPWTRRRRRWPGSSWISRPPGPACGRAGTGQGTTRCRICRGSGTGGWWPCPGAGCRADGCATRPGHRAPGHGSRASTPGDGGCPYRTGCRSRATTRCTPSTCVSVGTGTCCVPN